MYIKGGIRLTNNDNVTTHKKKQNSLEVQMGHLKWERRKSSSPIILQGRTGTNFGVVKHSK